MAEKMFLACGLVRNSRNLLRRKGIQMLMKISITIKKDAILENMRLYHMPYKGYPAITPGNDKVLGEIMVINEEEYDETVKDMDEMEGFISENNPENEYHKIVLEVKNLQTNEKEKCFVYFYNKDKDKVFDSESVYIPNGDWKEYMLTK